MIATTKTYNRAELLQLALDGKVKKGDKFKDEAGSTVTFDGLTFNWNDGMALKLMLHKHETFTPVIVDNDVTITLKQSEINDLAATLGLSVHFDVKEEMKRQGVTLTTTGSQHTALFHRFMGLQK